MQIIRSSHMCAAVLGLQTKPAYRSDEPPNGLHASWCSEKKYWEQQSHVVPQTGSRRLQPDDSSTRAILGRCQFRVGLEGVMRSKKDHK